MPPATASATANAVTLLRRRDGLVGLEEGERIAFGVLAASEPADVRDRLLVLRLTAELTHLRQVGVNVVGPEVEDGTLHAAVARVHRAAPAVVLEHPIIHSRHPRVLDRPAAQPLPELLAPVRVLGGELDVHNLLAHALPPFFAQAIPSAHGQSICAVRRSAGAGPLREARRVVRAG